MGKHDGEFLQDDEVRKAVAVYYIRDMLDRDYKGKKHVFAREIIGVSMSWVSRWTQPRDMKAIPDAKHIRQIEAKTNYSVEMMLKQTVSAKDIYGILKDNPTAERIREEYSIGKELTHDDSDAHITNLSTLAGHRYDLFYLEPNSGEVGCFHLDRIEEPRDRVRESGKKSKGRLELRMSRGKNENDYIGTIVAPPEMGKVFMFISQKNADGRYLDRGMVVLCFPQERVRNSGGYQCGVGVAMTMDRHDPHNVLIQRVALRDMETAADPKINWFIREYLKKPVRGNSILTVDDLEENQKELYSFIRSGSQSPKPEEATG